MADPATPQPQDQPPAPSPARGVGAEAPGRAAGLRLFGLGVGPTELRATPAAPFPQFDEARETYEGMEKFNRPYFKRDLRDFAEFFAQQCAPEPHSTKQIE